jgi:hypothetical protein
MVHFDRRERPAPPLAAGWCAQLRGLHFQPVGSAKPPAGRARSARSRWRSGWRPRAECAIVAQIKGSKYG